ncbi:MAG: ABC transporter permease [Eubacterium sp.]|nr:ABC transporter permease [Eubacterium sp.]
MFKNLDKVFKFTFRNQVKTKGYLGFTIFMAILLLLVPTGIMLLVDKSGDKEEELKPCGADRVYVVNESTPDTDYNMFNSLGIDGYTDIQYSNSETVEDALDTIAERGEKTSLVLQFSVEDDVIADRIIVPEESDIDEDTAENLYKFLDEGGQMVSVISSGISFADLQEAGLQTEVDVYNSEGYTSGQSLMDDEAAAQNQIKDSMLPIFRYLLIIISIIVIYTMVIVYGNGINQNVVMEKSSKLMDTMLVSIQPQALITGKMIGVLSAAIIQILVWTFSALIGVVGGIKVMDMIHPGTSNIVLKFLKSFGELGLFKPVNIIIAVLALLLGIVLYASLSAMSGAISNSREEAAANQSVFIIIVLASFYLVMFFGLKKEAATWLYLIPFTSTMVLPAGICTGTVSTTVGLGAILIMLVTSIIFLVLAGKLYVMMSLYKGNKVNLRKAFKMLFQKA